jgi:hypothetical protein
MPTTATPVVLTDPGYLFWAPLLSAEPANTVSGSKFTDAWPGAWLSLGATESGSDFTYETKLAAVSVAEFFDPIKWATTDRQGSFAFALANYTLTNWSRALNGGTLSVVSGSGATQLNSYVPPTPGSEVRAMLGWESLDGTMRIIVYQGVQGGSIKTSFDKAPKYAAIPCQFNFEIPASGFPFKFYTAGTSRA